MRLPTWGGRSGKVWLFTAVALVVFMTLSSFLGSRLGLSGADLWILRAGLWILGLVGAGLVVWFARPARGSGAASDEELETLLEAAGGRLKAGFGNLPLVLVLGPPGSAKTSVVVNSGLDPDLLAGAVYQGDAIGPTGCVNVWYTQQTLVVEAGGAFATDPARYPRLVRRVRPRRLIPALTGGAAAARAAVVCFSCEELLKPGAAEAVPAAARALRERLVELARGCGAQVPVYAIFTKADRLRFFPEYVRSLAREEAQEVFGATLPWPGPTPAGVHAEREFSRVDEALRRLFGGLTAKRMHLLAREGETEGKAGVYEFPRELQKVGHVVTQFLVELCRPGQLQVGPVLRGFYFTGVRAVIAGDVGPALQLPAAGAGRIAATQVFEARGQQPAPAPAPAVGGGRKKPQWLFLARLFNDVLLRDRAALAAAKAGATTRLLRRAALGLAAVVFVILDLSIVSSCERGRRLAARAEQSGRELVGTGSFEPDLPPADALRRLDRLRAAVEDLADYRSSLLGWTPDALYDEMRRLYYGRFSGVLLDPARESLLGSLQGLTERGDYGNTFRELQAYLMTTSEARWLDAAFLVPIITERWIGNRRVDPERRDLIRRQFEFYAGKLCRGYLPCTRRPDEPTVARVRDLLKSYAGPERVFEFLVSQASAGHPRVQFNRQYPGTEAVLVDPYEVPYAFTADGWRAVRDSLRRSDRDFQTADWVLGEQARLDIDRAQLESEVWSLYWADYVRHWRAFLDSATLVRFTGVQDAAQKLKTLTDNPSPLLQLLALASQNTAVESPIVKQAFQPVHLVMPPALKDRYVDSSNKAYMDALIGLSGIVQQAATTRSGEADGLVGPTLESTRSAAGVVRQLAQQFHTTPEAVPVGQAVRRLLEEPVSRVERMIVRMPAAAANARGASLCQRFAALKRKYPFSGNPGGPEATLDEVAGFFQPGSGALWQAYDQAWRNLLVQQGSAYAPAAGGSVTPTRAFVEFFNRAADFSAAVWPEGAAEATLGFRLRLRPTVAFPSATLNVDGRPYSFTQTDVASRTITWTGAGVSEVRLLVGIGRPGREVPVLEYGGTWALFKLFQRAQWRADGQRHILEWRVQVPQHPTPITLEGELTFNRAQPVLRAQWLERMTCVSQVVP